MGATHHLHPNVRFLQLQSSDEKSTVRSDRRSLIKLKRLTVWLAFFIRLIGQKVCVKTLITLDIY